MKYTFCIIAKDGTAFFPAQVGNSPMLNPIDYWTVSLKDALTWNNTDDLKVIMNEYTNAKIIEIKE